MLRAALDSSHHVGMTVVILVASVVSVLGVIAWLGLLIWAAKGDGRVQREHDRDEHDPPTP
jgi:hypothetical protein